MEKLISCIIGIVALLCVLWAVYTCPPLLLLGVLYAIVFGCIKLSEYRWGEVILLVILALLLPITAWKYAENSFQCNHRIYNMDEGLKRCGVFLKEGRSVELHRRLEELIASKEFHTSNAYQLSCAFHIAVSEEDANGWLEESMQERKHNAWFATGIGLGIWLLFAVGWWVLYAKVHRPKPRRALLVLLPPLTLVAFLFAQMAMIDNGYSQREFEWDIRKLAGVLEQKTIPAELQSMLETPTRETYSFLRGLPKPNTK